MRIVNVALIISFGLLACKVPEPTIVTRTVITERVVKVDKEIVVEKLRFQIFDITGTGINDLIKISQYADPETYAKIMLFIEEEIPNTAVASAIVTQALAYNIPVLTAIALAWQESQYNPSARNVNPSSVDVGLYQLNSKTFSELTREDLLNPARNAQEAMEFLNYLILRFESWDLALVAYNAGPTSVVNQRIPWTTFQHVVKINAKVAELEKTLVHILMIQPEV